MSRKWTDLEGVRLEFIVVVVPVVVVDVDVILRPDGDDVSVNVVVAIPVEVAGALHCVWSHLDDVTGTFFVGVGADLGDVTGNARSVTGRFLLSGVLMIFWSGFGISSFLILKSTIILNLFCSTSLPLASTRLVQFTLSNLSPLL